MKNYWLTTVFLFFLAICESMPLEDPHSLYLEAYDNYTRSKYPEAVPKLKRSIELDPNFSEAYFLLSRVYFKMGQPRVAIQTFKKGQTLRRQIKEHREFMKSETTLKVRTGVHSIPFRAIHRIREAERAYYQGKRARQEGNWYEAIEYFERAASYDNEQTHYLNAWGESLLDVKDPFSAAEVFQTSLRKNPFQRDLYVQLIRLNHELNFLQEGLDWTNKARKYYPADSYFKDRQLFFEHKIRISKRADGEEEY